MRRRSSGCLCVLSANSSDSVWPDYLNHNLVAPKKPAEGLYKDLGPLVKAHLTPRPTVMAARFRFHTRT